MKSKMGSREIDLLKVVVDQEIKGGVRRRGKEMKEGN